MLRLKLLPLVIGCVLLFIGYQETRLASIASTTASDVTLADLERSGSGDNAHLRVSDFVLCTWDYVVTERKGKWSVAWVPAVAQDGRWFQEEIVAHLDENGQWPDGVDMPRPTDVKVVFKLTKARNDLDVAKVAAADSIEGMVINEIEGLDRGERDLLESSYPTSDFSSVTLFEPERQPMGMTALVGLILGGLVSMGLWVFFFLRGRKAVRPAA